jgi:uncharacterized OsmC-like protein
VAQTQVREAAAGAVSTETVGRVICHARDQYLVVDGLAESGCPSEAINPAEVFLAGVAACGVELMQVLAKQQGVPLQRMAVDIRGTQDRSRPVRPNLAVINSVYLQVRMKGVTEQQGKGLVEAFKSR